MRMVNDTYHVRTYVPHTYVRTNVPTPPALCLGTPVPRQKIYLPISTASHPLVINIQLMVVGITRVYKSRHTTWVLWWNQSRHSTTTRL